MSLYDNVMRELKELWAVENPDQDNLDRRIALVKTMFEIKILEQKKELETLEEELKIQKEIEAAEADIASLESQLAALDEEEPPLKTKPELTVV